MDELRMFDIVYADFTNDKKGSEQAGIHPYIIIQNNIGNKYCPTVLGMSLTSTLKNHICRHTALYIRPVKTD